MTMSLIPIARLLGLGLAAGSCCAADLPRLGLSVHGSCPTGSLKEFTEDPGYGLGAFAEWELDTGSNLRLAYEGTLFRSTRDTTALSGLPGGPYAFDSHRKPRSHALLLEYLYFPRHDNEGFYFLLGAGGMNYQARNELTGILPTVTWSATTLDETGTKLACVAGLGYEFTKNLGASARYSFITVNNRTLGGVQAGFSYRF
jgi:opacity protein-like surface antigen